MVKAALANVHNHNKFQFKRGNAEDLVAAGIESETVDLVTAGKLLTVPLLAQNLMPFRRSVSDDHTAQSCHWFDWSKVWPEMERVLRVGGTAAFWVRFALPPSYPAFINVSDYIVYSYIHSHIQVYSEFRLPEYPSLTPLITAYAQGTDPFTSLGPHFERPGRTILENHLLDVPSPDRVNSAIRLGNEKRVYFAGQYSFKPSF